MNQERNRVRPPENTAVASANQEAFQDSIFAPAFSIAVFVDSEDTKHAAMAARTNTPNVPCSISKAYESVRRTASKDMGDPSADSSFQNGTTTSRIRIPPTRRRKS